jgi:mannose-6-phosphate isomerase-like protein (cupin superfamily)
VGIATLAAHEVNLSEEEDMKQSELSATILKPLQTYELMGEQVEIILTGAVTDNKVSLVLETSPPGGGPPPHIHENEDEVLIVLRGRFEILCGTDWQSLNTGESALVPKRSVHTFRNAGTEPGQIAAWFYPAGFERFFGLFADGLTSENLLEHLRDAGQQVGTTFLVDSTHLGQMAQSARDAKKMLAR